MSSTEAASEVRALEDARCQALMARDFDKLDRLLASELVHVHANGQADDRETYLSGIRDRLEYLRVARPDLVVRVFGDSAVTTGVLDQTIRVKASGQTVDMRAFATQVWAKVDGSWKQVSFHASNL